MISDTKKRRTASTAVLSKTQLPKINTNFQDKDTPITKKLFNDSKTITHRQYNKSSVRDRIHTEANTERASQVYPQNNSRMQNVGLRKLEEQLADVSFLFRKIEKLRQSYGIVSLNERGEEEERASSDCQQVPYDPTLHEMNEEICLIKSQIEDSLEKVFRLSKQHPRLQHMIEGMLEQNLKDFLVENGRNGKIAAMKAQHRLIQSSREKLARMCRF